MNQIKLESQTRKFARCRLRVVSQRVMFCDFGKNFESAFSTKNSFQIGDFDFS